MAEHHDTSPAELGAPMDYKEHESTYNLFLALSKWGVVFLCLALVAAMAFGFFAGGFFSATVLFIVICLAAWFFL